LRQGVSSYLDEHLGYVADSLRLAQFRAAIAKIVCADDRIADVGCGTGILGLLCLQAGAAQVYAIDSTAMIGVAQESLTRAGWGDRALFIRGKAHQVDLPEQVDVVICDQVGYFGFDYGIVQTLNDARRRFLKPGGTLIPARVRLQVGAVESIACQTLAEGWRAEAVPFEFHWLHERAVNTRHSVQLQREALLGAPAELGAIDFRQDNPDFFSWTVELRIERDGVLHGLAGWFECELAEDVWMTNSPLSDQAIQRPQAFLPIGEAVAVKSGEAIKATVMVRPADHLIAWQVEIPSSGRNFSHSTWKGELLSPEEIARRDPAHVPMPSRTAQARVCVLAYCDGLRTVGEIEQAVLREHPDLLPSAEEISRFVAQVLCGDTA
jgi:protein arginine N-methyltransferase 1